MDMAGKYSLKTEKKSGISHLVLDDDGDIEGIELDELRLAHCDIIHIHGDGTELLTLRGAWKMIKEYKPVIVIDVSSAVLRKMYSMTLSDLHSWFERHGYELVDSDKTHALYVPVSD